MPVILSVTHPDRAPVIKQANDTRVAGVLITHALHMAGVDLRWATTFTNRLVSDFNRAEDGAGAELTYSDVGLTFRIDPVKVAISPARWEALLDRVDAQLVADEPDKES